jgi:hypothetical protein
MKCHMECHLEDRMGCHLDDWMKRHMKDQMRYAYTVNDHDCMKKKRIVRIDTPVSLVS